MGQRERFLTSWVVLVVVTGGCEPGADISLARRVSRIVNGILDTGHPGVGLLSHAEGMCSGTLIGPRTVLTAAHCVTMQVTAPYSIVSGISFEVGGKKYLVASVVMHPGFDYSEWYCPDFAVLRLAQEVQGIAPYPLASTPPLVGEAITLVGFGKTSTDQPYTDQKKRKGPAVVSEVRSGSFAFTGAAASVCHGDSGGPSFAVRDGKEIQIGVHAILTPSLRCEDGAIDARVDAYRDWIIQQSAGDLSAGPPLVKIVSPQNLATVGTSVAVQVDASGEQGVVRVELSLDGKIVDQRVERPYQFQLSDLAPGSHSLSATAVSTAGPPGSAKIEIQVEGPSPPTPPAPASPPIQPPSQAADPDGSGRWVGGCSLAPTTVPAPSLLVVALLLWRRRSRAHACGRASSA